MRRARELEPMTLLYNYNDDNLHYNSQMIGWMMLDPRLDNLTAKPCFVEVSAATLWRMRE